MVASIALLAHQGGWDEILLVVGPILAVAGLLILAKRRVDAAATRAADDDGEPGGSTSADGNDESADSPAHPI